MDGFSRDINGRLHDLRGRFVKEGEAAGRGFSLGVGRGLAGLRGILGRATQLAMTTVKASVAAAGLAAVAGAGAVALTGLASAAGGAIPVIVSLVAALTQAAGALAIIPGAITILVATMGVLKLGMVGVGDAMKAVASGDAEKLNEALKKLAPNAQRLVRQVAALKPAFDKIRLGVQNRLFAQTDKLLAGWAKILLPLAIVGFGGLADVINRSVVAALAALNTRANANRLAAVLAASTAVAASLGVALRPIGQALLDAVAVGAQLTAELSQGVGAQLTLIAGRISEMAASGALRQMILDGVAALGQFVGLGRDLLGILGGIARAAGGAEGGGIFGFFDRLNALVNRPDVQASLAGLFDSLTDLGVTLTPVLVALFAALVPVAKGIAAIAEAFAPGLTNLLTKLGDALAHLEPGFVALAPLVDSLAAGLMPLAQILVGLVTGAGPGLKAVLDGLVAALQALAPVAPEVGRAIGDLLTTIAPLLPVLGVELARVLIAAVPLLLELARTLTPIIPDLARMLHLLAKIATIFLESNLATMSLNAGMIILGSTLAMANAWLNVIGIAVRRVVDFLGGGREAVEGFGRAAKEGFGKATDAVRELPGKVMAALGDTGRMLYNAGANIINGLINGIKDKIGELKGVLGGITNLIPKIKGPAAVDRRLLFGSGRLIMTGLIAGIHSAVPELRSQLQGITGQIGTPAFAGAPAPAAAAAPEPTVFVVEPSADMPGLEKFVNVRIRRADQETARRIRSGITR